MANNRCCGKAIILCLYGFGIFFCYVVYIFGSCTTLHVKSECEPAFMPYLSGMQIACACLYHHLWPVWLYHISPNYLKKGKIFERKKFLNTKCPFWISLQIFSTSPVWKISHSAKNSARYYHECTAVFMYRTPSDFHKTWIFSTNFRETPKYQISWKSVRCESRCSMRTDGRTDEQTWNS